MFWEENFTGKGKFFSAVNMKNCGRRNVGKHREIKGSDKYITLEIWVNIDSLNKTKFTSSESKDNSVRSVKGVITYMGIKAKVSPHK